MLEYPAFFSLLLDNFPLSSDSPLAKRHSLCLHSGHYLFAEAGRGTLGVYLLMTSSTENKTGGEKHGFWWKMHLTFNRRLSLWDWQTFLPMRHVWALHPLYLCILSFRFHVDTSPMRNMMRRWWPSPANVRIMKGNSGILLSGYILPTEILCFGLPTVSND